MTRPTRADPGGHTLVGTPTHSPAAHRSTGLRTGDEHFSVRRADRPAGTHDADDQPLVASWNPQPAPHHRKAGAGDAGGGHRRAGRRRAVGPLARTGSAYGWRGYALPVLVALTVLALLDVARSPAPVAANQAIAGFDDTPGATRGARRPLIPNPEAGPGFERVKAAAELPGGGPFTVQGAGTWQVIPGAGAAFGAGQLITYTVEIEDGVQIEGGSEGFATTVDNTLNNPKSWIGSGHYQFQRIDDPRAAELRISLTSQLTTRGICGYQIPFDASCWKADDHRVVINVARWVRGAVAFQGNVVQYDQYVVNHEVGHGLGFAHTSCPANGRLAPVMMQQTWGVADDYLAALGTDRVAPDAQTCEPNAWPFPMVN